MRIECPKFKKEDGTEISIIVDIMDMYSDTIWKIADVKYRLPRKRKWIFLSCGLREKYQYSGLSQEERAIKRRNDLIDFVGEAEIHKALEYAYGQIKPTDDNYVVF